MIYLIIHFRGWNTSKPGTVAILVIEIALLLCGKDTKHTAYGLSCVHLDIDENEGRVLLDINVQTPWGGCMYVMYKVRCSAASVHIFKPMGHSYRSK